MANPGRLTATADAALLPLSLVFVAAGFVLAPEPVWAALFYVGGVPLLLWRVLPAMRPALGEPLLLLPLLLIGWLALTLLWSAPAESEPSRWLWLWNCFCTLGFFLSAVNLAGKDGRRLATVLIAAGGLNAAWAIGRFLAAGGTVDRMPGWAETRHPILGAAIIGLCLILALGRVASARGVPRLGLLVAVAVMAVFIWLTGSRGPLAAVLAGSAMLLFGLPWRWVLGGALALLAAVLAVHLYDPSIIGDAVQHMADRGWSQRLDIWQQSLQVIREAPLFGHGLTALLPRARDQFPHDLYLSTWLYGGAVGLALLLASLLLVARGLWRAAPVGAVAGWERLSLAGMGVCTCVVGLTDLSQVVKGPGPLWYIVWLPLAMSIAFIRRQRGR
jgi:O-antigen ligase